MDRNINAMQIVVVKMVALRKESVDRNIDCNCNLTQKKHVALRKESVDRNPLIWTLTMHKILSLSARRAWIEIILSR